MVYRWPSGWALGCPCQLLFFLGLLALSHPVLQLGLPHFLQCLISPGSQPFPPILPPFRIKPAEISRVWVEMSVYITLSWGIGLGPVTLSLVLVEEFSTWVAPDFGTHGELGLLWW